MADTTGLIFMDFETRSKLDLKKVGSARYARNCAAIILTYAIGDDVVRDWHRDGEPLHWEDAPADLKAAVNSGMTLVAWHAGFDMQVWIHAFKGPVIPAARALDARVLAAAANLPPDLEGASQVLMRVGKDKQGKKLIRKFSVDGDDPRQFPTDWADFCTYARIDTTRMRDIWRRLLPLPPERWDEYHAAERINRRGVPIDLGFAELAAELAIEDRIASGARIRAMTDGEVRSITDLPRMKQWLHDRLDPEACSIIARKIEAEDDDEDDKDKKVKLKLKRQHIMQLLAYLGSKADPTTDDVKAQVLLELRLYGGGASQGKFQSIVDQAQDGRLAMTYVFNGATQTGRFSSKRPQLHNLTRQSLSKTFEAEGDMIDALIGGQREFADGVVMARRLALLVRPTIIAPPKRRLVWGDWSSIESRVIAWLANDRSANAKLDLYRAIDADATLPDMYKQIAAGMYGIAPASIDKTQRQSGKIGELACGFAGGKGALQSMAANYGLHFSDEEAQAIVDLWRAANPWAQPFWNAIWDAAMMALDYPGSIHRAGMLLFHAGRYLGGNTLFMQLPSGRRLTYPDVRVTKEKEYDADGEVTGYSDKLTFRRDRRRVKMWKGLIAENATQGTAADVLTGTLLRVETKPFRYAETCLHTHDEILLVADEEHTDEASAWLGEQMMQGFAWSEGLPLHAVTTNNLWYSKAGD